MLYLVVPVSFSTQLQNKRLLSFFISRFEIVDLCTYQFYTAVLKLSFRFNLWSCLPFDEVINLAVTVYCTVMLFWLNVLCLTGVTVPTVTTSTPTPPTSTRPQPALSLACNFDSDTCNFYQDQTDNFNWNRRNGPSYNPGTGPSADHTQGDFSGWLLVILWIAQACKTHTTEMRDLGTVFPH